MIAAIFLVLAISVGFVLFIACANVANMVMARSASRTREIAVRLALGSRRSGILRSFAAEAFLLSLGGALAGSLSREACSIFWSLSPRARSGSCAQLRSTHRVLLFALSIAAVTPLFFALLPALSASRPDLAGSLKEGARSGTEPLARSVPAVFS